MSALILFTFCLVISLPDASSEQRPIVRASDVVFMYASGSPSQYDAYNGTVVGWGGRPRTRSPNDVDRFRQRVEETRKRDMRYCASVDFLVDFGGFIDFRPDTFFDAVCRDLDGNPLRVPWLWDHKHKGHPAYWFCTNNPEYQEYLRDQTERACLAPIDGLHIDDYSGTSACSAYNGGCFCTFCMEGFREYLRKTFSSDQLKRMGIRQITHFHYGEFLESKGITAETYKNEHWKCPLISVFQEFQNLRMKEWILEIFQHAERLRGKPLLRSINSSASSPRTLIPAPSIDYFCGEVPHHASSTHGSLEPVFVFKVVESLTRRQTATASGQDWAWIKANDKPGLVRTWIAQAYAFGSVFMVPHNQWCYTRELGTHWWHGKPEDFAYLYQFVRENHSLLDGYISLTNTALIYSTPNYRTIREAAFQLAEANIPYGFIVTGSEELPIRLDPKNIALYDYLIVGSEVLENDGEEILRKSRARVVQWKNRAGLPEAIKQQVSVKGSDRIRLSLRYNPNHPDAPVVCHLLNQNYDPKRDDVHPTDVRISIRKDLLEKASSGNDIKTAQIHVPKREPAQLEIVESNNVITFEVKNLGLWAIIEL